MIMHYYKDEQQQIHVHLEFSFYVVLSSFVMLQPLWPAAALLWCSVLTSGSNHILKSGGRRSQRLTGFESFFPKTNIFRSTLRSKRSFMVTNGLSCYFYGPCRSRAPRIITFLLHMAAPAKHKLQVCWSTETCHVWCSNPSTTAAHMLCVRSNKLGAEM